MKARKLKSGNWNVRVTVCGQSYSFTHPNKKTAIRLAAAFSEEVKENIANPPLIDAIARYIDKGSETLSPATVRGYRSIERTLRKKHPALCQKLQPCRPVDSSINTTAAKQALIGSINNGIGVILCNRNWWP